MPMLGIGLVLFPNIGTDASPWTSNPSWAPDFVAPDTAAHSN